MIGGQHYLAYPRAGDLKCALQRQRSVALCCTPVKDPSGHRVDAVTMASKSE